MSKRRCVPVRDHFGKAILFRRTREEAERMIASGICFVLMQQPLELALVRAPGRTQLDIQNVRPDRSLTMPPSVIQDAVDGVESARGIVAGYEANHGGCKNLPTKEESRT